MTKPEYYHFHRDCAYYDQFEIKEDRVDGHNVIRFKCPALNHSELRHGEIIRKSKFAFEYVMELEAADENI